MYTPKLGTFKTLKIYKSKRMSQQNITPVKRKEIYKYEAPWTLYGMNWSIRPDKRFRLALGSFIEEYNNKVQIVMLDEDSGDFTARSIFDHPYPTTKIMWIPDTVEFKFLKKKFIKIIGYLVFFAFRKVYFPIC